MDRLKLTEYVKPLPGFSHENLKIISQYNIKFDFVFIDASHHYKDLITDFELVYPLVKKNGWIAFHDVSPSWPGPWRVWIETAMPLLSSHEYNSTIACGQKSSNQTFIKPSSNTFFNFSMNWAEYLEEIEPDMSAAIKTIIMADGNDNDSKLDNADIKIASMPKHAKFSLREMLKLEASIDPYLHYFNALVYINEKKYNKAIDSFLKAKPSVHLKLTINRRIDYHIKKLKSFC